MANPGFVPSLRVSISSHSPTFLQRKQHAICSASDSPESSSVKSTARRTFLHQAVVSSIAILVPFPLSRANSATSTLTNVYLNVSVAGKEKGRIVLQLDSSLAPRCVETFVKLANGKLTNKSGSRSISYYRSIGTKVIPGNRIYMGKINQIDSLNQSPGTPQRQQLLIPYPFNEDTNDLKHDQGGLVSVEKGGSFEFCILTKSEPQLDVEGRVIIGKVIEGMDVVNELVQIPTNKKTIRDGFRNVGKGIGDSRANVQVCYRLLLLHALCKTYSECW